MKVDPTTTDIHDLTDAEARDLRDLCEEMMRGPAPIVSPLFDAWCVACGCAQSQRLLAFATAFAPRALFALLRRAEAERDDARRWGFLEVQREYGSEMLTQDEDQERVALQTRAEAEDWGSR